ncbi:hypothetical protein B0H19DRAFT_1242770 [Mycena capillaripes]|nr:hypothetical protein B0H19DRAFT_1242770 [Mycena capillaripes]
MYLLAIVMVLVTIVGSGWDRFLRRLPEGEGKTDHTLSHPGVIKVSNGNGGAAENKCLGRGSVTDLSQHSLAEQEWFIHNNYKYGPVGVSWKRLKPESMKVVDEKDSASGGKTGDKTEFKNKFLKLGISFPETEEQPPFLLRGFDKLCLAPGEKKTATFELTRKDLSVWDVYTQRWKRRFTLSAGASSRDLRSVMTHTFAE